MAPTLAAISAVMFAPFYPRVLATMPEKPEAASAPTLAAVAMCTPGPLIGVVALAASQKADVGSGARALLSHQFVAPTLADLPEWAPFRDKLAHAGPQIAEKAGETATAAAGFIGSLLTALTALTRRMVGFFLNIFAHLYALHIFLPFKVSALRQVMAHTRLTPDMPAMLSARIAAISRAISRGTLLIGMVQGALGGLGFWAAGIDGAACWAVMITAPSVILTLGGAFVVIGGAIYLAIEDNTATALVLGLWCGLWGGKRAASDAGRARSADERHSDRDRHAGRAFGLRRRGSGAGAGACRAVRRDLARHGGVGVRRRAGCAGSRS
ncbi:MAG: putative PurR-regulated permease PerM [Paracoccaceae bacterium]